MAVFSIICDYLIFFGFLIGSTLFPLWGNLLRRKKSNDQSDTKANYVFASGQVGIFAMMLSIARGTLGVRAFLGKCYTLRNLPVFREQNYFSLHFTENMIFYDVK